VDFAPRVGDRKRLVARAVLSHCVEGVTEVQDPSSKGDLIAAETTRIALAVPTFVMGMDDLARVSEKGDVLQDPSARLRVLLHELQLGVGVVTEVHQHAGGHGQLPDVVQDKAIRELRITDVVRRDNGR